MASGTAAPGPASSAPAPGKFVEYDRYIQTQLTRARRQVQSIDLALAVMTLAAGALVYLLLVAMVDHWVVPGGMGFFGRMACLVVFVAGSLAFIARRLIPPLLWRINPVFAAHTIERNRPGLKNSLVNFLLLRSNRELAPAIYEAIEEQAAEGLAGVTIESAVDRTPLIRWLYVLAGVVLACAMYKVFSPKDPLRSVGRVMAPWSDLPVPTRARITDVQPGDTDAFHDQHVTVSAFISGVRDGDRVQVIYSSTDDQVRERPAPMTMPEGSNRYQAELPGESAGLQADLQYRIVAADAISPTYRIRAVTAPSIEVRAVDYKYPAYSELGKRRVDRLGDLRGLEGTEVTLHADASHPIKSASLDLGCDGRRDLPMQVKGRQASVKWKLALKPGTDQPEHDSYQLLFTTEDGHDNPQPIRYKIEVVRDLPPELTLIEPAVDPKQEIKLPEGTPLRLRWEASDPDFKLKSVTLLANKGPLSLLKERLLAEPRSGQFRRDFVLHPDRHGLKQGDEFAFWAVAEDNKQPQANVTESPRYKVQIVSASEAPPQPQDQLAQNDRQDQPQPRGTPPQDNQQARPMNDGQNSDAGQESEEASDNDRQGKSKQSDKSKQRDRKKPEQDAGDEPRERPNDAQRDPPADGAQDQPQDAESGEGEPSEAESGDGAGKEPQRGQKPGAKPKGEAGQPGSDDQKSDGGASGDTSENPPEESADRPGQKPEGIPEQDASERPSPRIDPETDPGRAIEEINKFEEQKRGKQKPEQKPEEPGKGEDSATEDRPDRAPQAEPDNPQKQKPQAADKPENGDGPETESGDQPDAAPAGAKKEKGDKPAGEDSPAERPKPDEEQRPGPGEQPSNAGAFEESGAGDEKTTAGGKGKEQKPGKGAKPMQDTRPGEAEQPTADGESADGDAPMNNAGQDTPREAGEPGDGAKPDKAQAGDDRPQDATGEREPMPGEGGQAAGEGEPSDAERPQEETDGEKPEGGDAEGKDKGDAGAGAKGRAKKGSPSPQNESAPREKQEQSPDGGKPDSDDEAESPSGSHKQSDSQGGTAGDQSGGGKKGGGQRSDSPGVGSAGQNTAADQGGGQANQQGEGPTGSNGGDQTPAGKPKEDAASGGEGPGSKKRKGKSKPGAADRADGEPADGDPQAAPGEPPPEGEADSEAADPEAADREQVDNEHGGDEGGAGQQPGAADGQPARRGNPTVGGQPGDTDAAPSQPTTAPEPGGEDPNLEYSRKATDLALQTLKDQLAKGELDPELLEKLKWTREDAERFIRRWEQLKKAAREPGAKGDDARAHLEETLRNLGLRPRGTSLAGDRGKQDAARRLRETRRTAPPAEYADQYREFSKGAARAAEDEE